MNDLTPEQIFNRYKKLKINKSTAIKNLDLIIKTNSDNRLRSKALEIIITNFLYESLDMLKWFFENETSQDILFKIYILLENNGDKLSRSVLRLMEEIIGNYYLINYDITSRDAMGLEFLTQLIREQYCASNLEKWHFDRFELKKGKVVSLDLQCVDIVVTKYVKLFKNLRKLILEDCCLSDFSNMLKLESLKISGTEDPQINSIDEIEGFEKLINLRELDLSRNGISEIKNLENYLKLRKLDLSYNYLEEIKCLDFLTELESLNLSSNRISEIYGLDSLLNLKELDLSENEDLSEIKGIDTLVKLESLLLATNKIGEIKNLNNLVNLKKLNLYKPDPMLMKDLVIEYNLKVGELIRQKRDIKELSNYFNEDQIKKKQIEYRNKFFIKEITGLDNLKCLEELDLRGNNITEINGFESLVNLKILKLDYNEISVIKGLENLNKLEFLSISNNNLISNSELPPILNESVGVINPQRFVEYCRQKKLKEEIEFIKMINEKEAKALKVLGLIIGKEIPVLEFLNDLDTKFGIILKNRHIIGINLSNCELSGFPEPIISFPLIEYLNLSNNNLTDLPTNIGANMPFKNLKEVNISNNQIPKDQIDIFVKSFQGRVHIKY